MMLFFLLFACCYSSVVQQLLATSDNGAFSSLALNKGLPVVAFTEILSNSSKLRILFCHNLACSNTTNKVLDADFAYHVSLVIQDNGNPFVSYSKTADVLVIDCMDSLCENFSRRPILPAAAFAPGWTSSVIVNGVPSVAFAANNPSGSSVYFSSCSNVNSCSTGVAYSYPIVNAFQWGSDRNMAVLNNNNPYIAFYIDGTGLLLLSCLSPTCAASSTRVLDRYSYNNDVGLYASVAVNRNNIPLVAYHDASNLALKMAFCSDIFCSFVTTRAFPSTYGWDPMVTFDAISGFPIVGYSNPSTSSLVIMSCADATCESTSSFPLITVANQQFETVKMVSSSFYQPLIIAHTNENEMQSVYIPADTRCLLESEYPCNAGNSSFRIIFTEPKSSPFVTNSAIVSIEGQVVNATTTSYTMAISNGGVITSLDTLTGLFKGSATLSEPGASFLAVSVNVAEIPQITAQLVIIYDPTPPNLSITLPLNSTATAATSILVQGTASDDYTNVVSVTVVVNGNQSFVSTTATPTWSVTIPLNIDTNNVVSVTAVDEAGNSITQTIVIIQAGTGPFLLCPQDAIVECGFPVPPFSGVQLLNCPESLQSNEAVVNICGASNVRRRTYSACGLSCIQTVTITDNTPPNLICPPSISLSCDDFSKGLLPTLTNATASDLCMVRTPIVFGNEIGLGNLNLGCGLTGVRNFVSTDDCNNIARCTQTIAVLSFAGTQTTTPTQGGGLDDGGGLNGAQLGGLIAGIVLLLLILLLALLLLLLWRKKKRRENDEAERLEILMMDNDFGEEPTSSADVRTNDLYVSNPNVSTESQDFANVF